MRLASVLLLASYSWVRNGINCDPSDSSSSCSEIACPATVATGSPERTGGAPWPKEASGSATHKERLSTAVFIVRLSSGESVTVCEPRWPPLRPADGIGNRGVWRATHSWKPADQPSAVAQRAGPRRGQHGPRGSRGGGRRGGSRRRWGKPSPLSIGKAACRGKG